LATDYIKGLRVRTVMQQAWAAMFADVDVVIAPTVPMVAPRVGEFDIRWGPQNTEPVAQALLRLTCPADLTGQPTLAVPVGFDSAGMPIGMQLTGRPFDEQTILRAGRAYESATDVVG